MGCMPEMKHLPLPPPPSSPGHKIHLNAWNLRSWIAWTEIRQQWYLVLILWFILWLLLLYPQLLSKSAHAITNRTPPPYMAIYLHTTHLLQNSTAINIIFKMKCTTPTDAPHSRWQFINYILQLLVIKCKIQTSFSRHCMEAYSICQGLHIYRFLNLFINPGRFASKLPLLQHWPQHFSFRHKNSFGYNSIVEAFIWTTPYILPFFLYMILIVMGPHY